VQSLRALPQQIAPPRDLWPQIQARIAAAQPIAPQQPQVGTQPGGARETPLQHPAGRAPALGWHMRLAAALGLLALGAALTAGVWITHGQVLSGQHSSGRAAPLGSVVNGSAPIGPLDAERQQALARSLGARLQALPAPSRQKVLADLRVIEQSMQDIQAALGRDPGNALLRQMLLETYQDEQHLFATVQEAGTWTREAGSGRGPI
jgi:hypothetical protein